MHPLALSSIAGIAAGVTMLLACTAAIVCCWRVWRVESKAAPSDDGWPQKPGLADRTNSEEAAGAQAWGWD